MILLGMSGFEQLGLIALILLLPFIALVDILRNEFSGSNKIIWVLVVLLFPILGAVLYFAIGTSQKVQY